MAVATGIPSKKEATAKLRELGIEVKRINQKDGRLYFVPANLPLKVPGTSTTFQFGVESKYLPAEDRYDVSGRCFVKLTEDEQGQDQAYVDRLNEIDRLVRANLRRVSMVLS